MIDVNNVQNIKAPIRSDIIPTMSSWTVAYEINNKWHKKAFLDVTEAYDFYKQAFAAMSRKVSHR